jgi:hypothetical protein
VLVSINSLFEADRPTTYAVANGKVFVRRLGEAKKPKAPEPPEPPKPVVKAVKDNEAEAERDATAAKKKAARAVAQAAAEKRRERTSQEKRAATIAKKRREAMKAAREKNQAERKAERQARRKAGLEKIMKKSAEKAADKAGQINAQLAHCILAVHVKRKKSVRGAWNICRASLTKYGYLKGPYREDGKVKDVKATQKGSRRAMQHANEKHPLNGGILGTPPAKFQKFRRIFKDIEPTV